MQTSVPGSSSIQATGPQQLASVVGGLVGAYALVRIGSYFFPEYTVPDFTFYLYVLVLIALIVFAVQNRALDIVTRTVTFAAYFILYYLFTLRDSPDLLDVFYRLRNIALVGFAVIFVILGVISMISGRFSKDLQSAVQRVYPTLVVSLILIIFSYAIVKFLADILKIVGV